MTRISTSLFAVIASVAAAGAGGMVSSASATPFAAPAAMHAAEMLSESVRHPVVSACYKKKVCAKWTSHTSRTTGYSSHYCAEYTMKTVCDPDLLIGSKAPQSGPPRIDPPRLATPMHFRAQVQVQVRVR